MTKSKAIAEKNGDLGWPIHMVVIHTIVTVYSNGNGNNSHGNGHRSKNAAGEFHENVYSTKMLGLSGVVVAALIL
ncbi:unnamed protein product [Ambrosiozyma monospora]|uniref:Unnamed protein product n=1 Tax=Ambrosiozyma monospora TaxID=43982 RepID=A0ACB5UBA8_AMBMO|nr:unnamed protein product [Ambrosiozyma monospora]